MTEIEKVVKKFSNMKKLTEPDEVELSASKKLYYKKYPGKIAIVLHRPKNWNAWRSLRIHDLLSDENMKRFSVQSKKRTECHIYTFFFEEVTFLIELQKYLAKKVPMGEIRTVKIEWSDSHEHQNFIRMPSIYKQGYRFKINFKYNERWGENKEKIIQFLRDRKDKYKVSVHKNHWSGGHYIGSYCYAKTEKDLVFFQFSFPSIVGRIERVVE